MKTLLTIMMLCIFYELPRAQVIIPRDLYAINTVWQSNEPGADREAYKLIKLVDPNWMLTKTPTNDATGFLATYAYTKDHKSWYKPGTCILTLFFERSDLSSKAISYQFTEKSTWDLYRNQVDSMNPAILGSGGKDGGKNITYQVNGLFISFTDYPPGIKDDERTYQIVIFKDK